MKERPILFSAPMVRAILEGQKTMTRRVIKQQRPEWALVVGTKEPILSCPHGKVGDRLWVRETWHCCDTIQKYVKSGEISRDNIEYRADRPNVTICDGGWTPSIHMPRWASRILLEITEVRVERLQDISEEDALDEGIREETNIIVGASCAGGRHHEITGDRYFYDGGFEEGYEAPIIAFRELWESINGPGSWGANPWVWVVCFRRIDS